MSSRNPWQPELVLLFGGAQLLCFAAGILAASLLHKFGVAGFRQDDDFGNILLATMSFQGVTWVLIPVLLRLNQIHWRDAFGLRKAGFLPRLGLGDGRFDCRPAGRADAEFSIRNRAGKGRLAAKIAGGGGIAQRRAAVADGDLSGIFRRRARARRGGIHLSRRVVSVRQAAWLAEARVVRRQFFVRADSRRGGDFHPAVRARARADVAL